MKWLHRLALSLVLYICVTSSGQAQRKPERVEAPKFSPGQYANVFFADPTSLLKGPRPSSQATLQTTGSTSNAIAKSNGKSTAVPNAASSDDEPLAWHNLISPAALEDLVKGSKLRLDKAITTPAAFAGGGFAIARREFSLQALLFAIIEKHPGEVRWKSSAAVARDTLSRVAANSKVGSQQVYAEAKKRLLDLGDLTNGTTLSGDASAEIPWGQLIDRVPLMQILDGAFREQVSVHTANPTEFGKNKESVQNLSELIAVLGKATLIQDMPDAEDPEYAAIAKEMIDQAIRVAQAAKNGDAELGRQAASKLGQSCNKCHETYK
jgi:Cytochrome C'